MLQIDILYVTYNRLEYTKRTLPSLLDSCDDYMNVWLWHNGNDRPTLDFVFSHRNHPRVARFVHSAENKKLREPTNWFWEESKAPLIGKVDDDLILPADWGQRMRYAHQQVPTLGVLGAWPFCESDFDIKVASPKIATLAPEVQALKNCWVGGGGQVMKRQVYEQCGPMRPNQSFPNWCIHASAKGWINGWLYPLIIMQNFDDPRHPECRLKSEEDFAQYAGLSLRANKVTLLSTVVDRLKSQALHVQSASCDPKTYLGLRARTLNAVKRLLTRASSRER